jgi:hypothetical protein
MAIVTLAPHVAAISGTLGNLTYVPLGGKQIIREKPKRVKRTAGQNLQPKRIKVAADYWRSVILTDPELKAFYFGLPHVPSMGAYQFFLRDFMHGPVVEEIDVSSYAGRVGDAIRIQASDDTGVWQVAVRISDMQGEVLEEGSAQTGEAGWVYLATAPVASDRAVSVSVTAKDRPGNSGSKSCVAYVPAR